ncbi:MULTISPECIES: Fe-S cluster assembly sulfur transfer protein SufU [Enterococcaceae]|uniref:Fe-S cluster assembly sulfur transfer protein SufU n=1 Tax=Enterococcaceae TaxID=81852 RepID=UPI000E544CDD|nr:MULTISPECIES: SUF system NifU family Fe-S cluster assembly protein [Enterococcaceae]MCI0129692.1 SUF system NifU family Fe-S cluster assembly protein [Vagococcus sp. CY53-2]RGI31853.1 SUF system NifU family Fe-S cluster assembly protein [Melissococcus sp. OM08-11BH]UNM90329.1 SUF system NifU family Fe-S cluster assembly protein [Vagococcus sp. CY52-2]
MALSRLDNLYRQVILDHTNHPHNKGVLDEATSQIELNNPTCGDVIQLQLAMKDGVIDEIAFDGHGCSISMASASMMTDAVKGKTEKEAIEIIADFLELVQGENIGEKKKVLKDAQMLGGVAKFPARIKCATLAWKALERGIIEDNQTVVTEELHSEE